jgi:general secretion pathway protein D
MQKTKKSLSLHYSQALTQKKPSKQTQKGFLSLIYALILTLTLQNSVYADKIDITLRDFASMVATTNNVNILIQNDVEDDKITFLVGDKNNSIYLPAFKTMLFLKGLDFKKHKNDFYYIQKIPEKEEEKPKKDVFHSVTLKNVVLKDVEALLKMHEAKYSYATSSNTVSFFCKPEHLESIKTQIAEMDVSFPQVQFKITVLDTNLDDLKERGTNISAYSQTITEVEKKLSFNYFLNLITMPYTASSNVVENSKSGFYGVLKYLNQEGFTQIKNSPIVTARSHSVASFSSGQNIPYLVQTNQVQSGVATKNDSYTYKDVGLKIELKPVIIGNDINFDLKLILEDLLSGLDSKTPITSKKELNSSYTLKKGELLVLSGINKESTLDSSFGIPILKDVFIVGELFKFESKSKTSSVITITIEVL